MAKATLNRLANNFDKHRRKGELLDPRKGTQTSRPLDRQSEKMESKLVSERDEARESAREESVVGEGIGDEKQTARFKGQSATPTRVKLVKPENFRIVATTRTTDFQDFWINLRCLRKKKNGWNEEEKRKSTCRM